MVGAHVGNMAGPREEKIARLIDFVRAGYRVTDFEVLDVDRRGRQMWTSNTITGVVENGQLIYAWGMQRDITAEKEQLWPAAKRVGDPPAREATGGRSRPAESSLRRTSCAALPTACSPSMRSTGSRPGIPGPKPSPAWRRSTSSAGLAGRSCTRTGARADRCVTALAVPRTALAPAGDPCRRLRSRIPIWADASWSRRFQRRRFSTTGVSRPARCACFAT
jgi:hypothetical protein